MSVVNPTSDFAVVQFEKLQDWKSLITLSRGFLTPDALDKLQSFLGPVAKSAIWERDYIDKDYRDTYSGFYSKKFAQYPSRTDRLHLFSEKLEEDDLFQLQTKSDSYIGYTVIRPTRVNCIGRSLLDPKKISDVSGHICLTQYKVHLLGTELTLSGFPYISQDSDVTVCAHAATWMVFRYFSERYRNYAEAYPYQISQMTSDLSHGRIVPSKGLTVYQLSEMFSQLGFYPEIYMRRKLADQALFDRLLYYHIESGIPVVAGLLDKRHAITLMGHGSDFSTVPPGNDPIYSSDFVTYWLANDDNHMPYQSIMKRGLPATKHCSTYYVDEIDAFVVPLYEKVYLPAESVERLNRKLLLNQDYGTAARSPILDKERIVVRLFLTSSKSYKLFRCTHPMPNEVDLVYRQTAMPKFIWVCELSTPTLYKQKKILGEIIWDSTANQHDFYAFLAVHYPEILILNDRDYPGHTPKRLLIKTLKDNDPYDLYESNLKGV